MRRWYGAGPLHLLSVLACFAISGYAVVRITGSSRAEMIGIWFAGAIIAHDLVLYPVYALLDHAVARLRRPRTIVPTWVNFVRVPTVLSGLVLLVAFPLIFGLNSETYRAASGRSPGSYLGRWLVFSAVVYGASGLLFAWRLLRARRRRTAAPVSPG